MTPSRIFSLLLLSLLVLELPSSINAQPFSSREVLTTLQLHNDQRKNARVDPLSWDFDLAYEADTLARALSKDDICSSPDARERVRASEANTERNGKRASILHKKAHHNPIVASDNLLTDAVQAWVDWKGEKSADYSKEKKRIVSKKETHVGCSAITGRFGHHYCTVAVCLYETKTSDKWTEGLKDEL
ncbi:hypothetical protein HDU67_004260 [Dinochytrium kinnereticum]|nr:hypothetical protein HDU67_004260 [Dinochytrium kinnereticum]